MDDLIYIFENKEILPFICLLLKLARDMGRVTAEKSYEAAVLPRRRFIGQARRYFDCGICRDAVLLT